MCDQTMPDFEPLVLCTCIRFSPWNRFVKRMRTHNHFNYEQTCEISFRTVGLRTWAPRLGVELELDRQVRAPDKQKTNKSKHHQPHRHESCGIAHHQRSIVTCYSCFCSRCSGIAALHFGWRNGIAANGLQGVRGGDLRMDYVPRGMD